VSFQSKVLNILNCSIYCKEWKLLYSVSQLSLYILLFFKIPFIRSSIHSADAVLHFCLIFLPLSFSKTYFKQSQHQGTVFVNDLESITFLYLKCSLCFKMLISLISLPIFTEAIFFLHSYSFEPKITRPSFSFCFIKNRMSYDAWLVY